MNDVPSFICCKLHKRALKPRKLMDNSHICIFVPMTVFKTIFVINKP